MAKKKAKKSKGRKRGRRVGALNLQGPVVKLLAVGAGFLMGDTINLGVDKIVPAKSVPIPGTDPPQSKMENYEVPKAVIEIGLGGLLLMNKKGGKLVAAGTTIVGGALAGAGLRRALKKMGVIKGYQSVPVVGRHRMAGYQDTPVIAGNGAPAQLMGIPGQLQGFKVNGGLGQNGYGSQGSGVMGSVISANANGSGLNNGSGYMG